MSSVKVLTIAKIVRGNDVEIMKKYAFVFPEGEDATVAALLLRLNSRPEFSDSTLSLQRIETFDKDFGAKVEVDAAYKFAHEDSCTATYVYDNAERASGSRVRSESTSTMTIATNVRFQPGIERVQDFG